MVAGILPGADRDMRIRYTGGVGFIGQHLARALFGAGHEAVALDNVYPRAHL